MRAISEQRDDAAQRAIDRGELLAADDRRPCREHAGQLLLILDAAVERGEGFLAQRLPARFGEQRGRGVRRECACRSTPCSRRAARA